MPLTPQQRNFPTCLACRREHGLTPESGTVWLCPIDHRPIHVNARDNACPATPPKFGAAAPREVRPVPSVPPRQTANAAWTARGPVMWAELHTAARAGTIDAAWLSKFQSRIGCGDCKRHWRAWVAANPLGADQVEWAWLAHNAVNLRLGKPGITLAEARAKIS